MAVAATLQLTETYRLVDDIPEVASEREQVRIGAIALLGQRKKQYEDTGLVEYLEVDALSTADAVLVTERIHTKASEEYKEKHNGLVQDCHRLVAEWYRKKRPEYFPPLRQIFNPDTEEFFSHGLSIAQMTENAIIPLPNNKEDEDRRINERVEEATPHVLRKLGSVALGTEVVRTISECTDKAIEDFAHDQKYSLLHRGYGGYVPEIKKLMIRDIRLDANSNDRFEEQIGLPGKYITHDIIQRALAQRNIDVKNMDKTKLHGTQMIASEDLMEFAELLDGVAGKEWCTNIFMGEEVAANHPKNYSGFREEALKRQESLIGLAEKTAQFVLDLARNNFDRQKAPGHVEKFVKLLLLDEAKKDSTIAEQMFDLPTARGLMQVAELERQGRFQESFELMQSIETKAPGGGYCGAGSCGLEAVNLTGDEGEKLKAKLGVEKGDTVVRDKERACKCGKKEIVYAYNKSKVTKYCEGCKAFETKSTK